MVKSFEGEWVGYTFARLPSSRTNTQPKVPSYVLTLHYLYFCLKKFYQKTFSQKNARTFLNFSPCHTWPHHTAVRCLEMPQAIELELLTQ